MDIKYINPLLKKMPWRRIVTADTASIELANPDFYYTVCDNERSGMSYLYLGNEELTNESCEGAHLINSDTYSTRPVYEVVEREVEVIEDGVVVKKTIKDEVIVGYDRVETVRSGLPEMIISQKASHLAQNGIQLADEGGEDHEGFDKLRSWKDSSGIDSGWLDLIYNAGKCGDAAMFIYKHGDDIEYTIYSFLKGDYIFPHKDSEGRDMLVRLYRLEGREAVDIISSTEISTWVKGYLESDSKDNLPKPRYGISASTIEQSWWDKVKGWFRNLDIKQSEDGWTRISRSESQLDKNTPQFVYLRFNDSFIGHAMENIEALDRALSYTSDKMRSTAFAKFLIKALKIKNLPPLSSGEEVIGIDGDAESLKVSDAGYVAPPDISNIATINIDNIFDAIMQSTMSIDLEPEILKSGADSSQTLKLLLRRELQWCHKMWPQTRRAAKHAVKILQGLTDKLENGRGRYTKLRISVWNTPWLPQDESAQIENATKLVYAGITSQESSRHELNMKYTDDVNLIKKEQEEKIYRETYIKLKAEADARREYGQYLSSGNNTSGNSSGSEQQREAENETKPGVDNNAPNK